MLKYLKQLFSKKEKVKNSNNIFTIEVKKSFSNHKINKDFIELLESNLIKSDIGVKQTQKLLTKLQEYEFSKTVTIEELQDFMQQQIIKILESHSAKLQFNIKPQVILFNGVNGSGKTTTIGKLAKKLSDQGHKILIAACDTYRAAATEQLNVWADRVGCKILTSDKIGGDPAALAYKALKLAQEEQYDVVLIDTAGRLQNNVNLMDQLGKIVRVLQKIDKTAPHLSLLVIDGTTGQNALKQLEIFKNQSEVNGLIITKLDGTAKGGVIVPMVDQFEVDVYFTANGEKISDIAEFNPQEFAKNLLS